MKFSMFEVLWPFGSPEVLSKYLEYEKFPKFSIIYYGVVHNLCVSEREVREVDKKPKVQPVRRSLET